MLREVLTLILFSFIDVYKYVNYLFKTLYSVEQINRTLNATRKEQVIINNLY